VLSVETKKMLKNMARKRRYSRNRTSGLGKAGNLVKQMGMGYLGAMVLGSVANKFAPQYSGIASIGGAYLVGGTMGALGVVLLQGIPTVGNSTASSVMVV